MVLIIRRMRVVAFQAIADGGKMDTSLYFTCVLVLMTLNAEFDRRYCFEIYSGNIIVYADLVAT